MALFLVEMGMQPDTYWALTVSERNAVVEAFNAKARRRK